MRDDAATIMEWAPRRDAALLSYVEGVIERLAQLPEPDLTDLERRMSAARWVLALSPEEPAARITWTNPATKREVRAEFTSASSGPLAESAITRQAVIPFAAISAAARIVAANMREGAK